MYKKRNNQSSSFGKPSFGSQKKKDRNRNYRKSSNRNRNKKRNDKNEINPSLFIRKADPITASAPYVPANKFEQFEINSVLKPNILRKGYLSPTPIQDKAIPFVLKGYDVVGIANTGTGKTAAFLIPLLDKILNNPREKVLIVVPTRELAIQINNEFLEFRRGLKIFSVCCVGGTSVYSQVSGLRRPHNFVIGTPGRLRDLVERKSLNLNNFKTVVLDEADRMLDMGFVNEMRFLISNMDSVHQTLFFSATTNNKVSKLIKEFLNKPKEISVKTGDTARNVEQNIIRIRHGEEKIDSLENLLHKKEFGKVLIFGRTKYGVEKLAKILIKSGFKADSIHGDKNQVRRQRALSSFRENKCNILVATDVAARGLDIPNVTHVINYDIPATYEDYIHRIGRTGRGNQIGTALTFIS